MKRIFKYELRLSEVALNGSFILTVPMPQYAKVLSVGNQDERLMAWALVDSTANMRDVEFKILGTGWNLADDELDGWDFLGTAIFDELLTVPQLVWHVWVRR